jgi:hypothetical protein
LIFGVVSAQLGRMLCARSRQELDAKCRLAGMRFGCVRAQEALLVNQVTTR